MNQEAELVARINQLELENGDLKGRVLVAEKQVADAKVAVQSYILELTRIGPATKELIKNMGIIQDQAMAVRQRLARVLTAWVAADALIAAMRNPQGDPNPGVQEAEKRYTEAKKELEKTNAPSEQPQGQPVGGSDAAVPHDRG